MPKTVTRAKRVAPSLIVAEPILTVLVAQDDEYTAYCPELDIATAMSTPEVAIKDLLELLREYAEDYMTNLETFARSPNRAHHLRDCSKVGGKFSESPCIYGQNLRFWFEAHKWLVNTETTGQFAHQLLNDYSFALHPRDYGVPKRLGTLPIGGGEVWQSPPTTSSVRS